ncbi:hypothetical protein H7F33_01260 [Pedobacter sp. PAMC26386]|nr:hypothetical protein H7F33_01260 [Pedobacter sp. PAMC26386]
MKRIFFGYMFFALLVLLVKQGNAQLKERKGTDFYGKMKDYDLSTVLMADSFLVMNNVDDEVSKYFLKREPALGFIGENYQRLFIHFISIVKNARQPYVYTVYGKTRVKENICSFRGTLKIIRALLFEKDNIPGYKQGMTICELVLYEDKKQSATGGFKGKLTSKFVIDKKGSFSYDGLNFASDGYANNGFEGSWTSYQTKVSKRCDWGDFRIPNSRKLDIGAGEFSVDERYLKNGWQSYRDANSNLKSFGYTEEIIAEARAKEEEQWWK